MDWDDIIVTGHKPVASLTRSEIHKELEQRDRLKMYFDCFPASQYVEENLENLNRIKDLRDMREWILNR